MMLKILATKVREIAIIWGGLSTLTVAVLAWSLENKDLFDTYSIELVLAGLTMVTSFIVWYSLTMKTDEIEAKLNEQEVLTEDNFKTIRISLLKADVDRFFTQHEFAEELAEDEMKYVYMLKDGLDELDVNSFSLRKVQHLLEKRITNPHAHDVHPAGEDHTGDR